jgi:hypothetical protein
MSFETLSRVEALNDATRLPEAGARNDRSDTLPSRRAPQFYVRQLSPNSCSQVFAATLRRRLHRWIISNGNLSRLAFSTRCGHSLLHAWPDWKRRQAFEG